MLEQLIQMTSASVQGYQDLLAVADSSVARDFLDVAIQEREAQCELLKRLYTAICHREFVQVDRCHYSDDPAAAELHVMWLRTIWSFERSEFGRFLDYFDSAEIMLEDALLTAANSLPANGLGSNFRDQAMSVCGCRQRMEELACQLASSSTGSDS